MDRISIIIIAIIIMITVSGIADSEIGDTRW